MDKNRDNNGRFTKNNCANPNGRPRKGKALTDILERYSKRRIENGDETKKSRKEMLAAILWDMALNDKDLAAIKYIYDRIDGRPKESIDQHIFQADNPVHDLLSRLINGEDEQAEPESETD